MLELGGSAEHVDEGLAMLDDDGSFLDWCAAAQCQHVSQATLDRLHLWRSRWSGHVPTGLRQRSDGRCRGRAGEGKDTMTLRGSLQLPDVLIRELDLSGGDVLVEMTHLRGPGNRKHDRGTRQQPG